MLLLLAGGLRLTAVLTVGAAPELHGDEGQYVEAAMALARGDGYPGSARPPGFPAFLAIVIHILGPDPQALRLAQIPLSLVTVLLVFNLVLVRFGLRSAFLSGLLCAASPTLVHYVHYLWAETLLGMLLLLTLWLLARFGSTGRVWPLVLAGLVLGGAALTREMSLIWALTAAVWIAVRSGSEGRLRHSLWFLLAVLLPILPWTLRNYGLHRTLVLVSTTRWYPIAEGNLLASGGDLAFRAARIRDLRHRYYGAGDEVAREADARRVAIETVVAEQPWWLAKKLVFNSYLLLAPTRNQMRRFGEQGWLPPSWAGWGGVLAAVEAGALVVGVGLGLAGLWLVPDGNQKELGAGLLLGFFAVYVAANATHRFRTPLLPVLLLWSGPLLSGQARIEPWRVLGACVTLSAFAAIVLVDLLCPPVVPFQQY